MDALTIPVRRLDPDLPLPARDIFLDGNTWRDGHPGDFAYVPEGGVPGYLVETWFNPPATQALAMPGWFDEHFRNMQSYRRMACADSDCPVVVKPGVARPASITCWRSDWWSMRTTTFGVEP